MQLEEIEVDPLSLGLLNAVPLEVIYEEDEVNVASAVESNGVVNLEIRQGLVPVTNNATTLSEDNLVLFWQDVQDKIKSSLTANWYPTVENNCLHLLLLSSGMNKVVQRSLIFNSNGDVQAYVHRSSIHVNHDFWKGPLKALSDVREVTSLVMSRVVITVYKEFREWHTCIGVPDEKLWAKGKPNCHVEEGFQNYRFNKTLRSSLCTYLVKRKVCCECRKLKNVLIVAKSRRMKRKAGTPSKFKPYSTLNTPERRDRLVRLRKDIRNLRLKNVRLVEKTKHVVDRDGLELDSDVNAELHEQVQSCNKLTDFQKILLGSQVKCASIKRRCGMKWHPAMIRFALNLKLTSNKAYNVVQKYIELPGQRTLFDYSHAFKVQEGIVDKFVGNVISTIDPTNSDSKKFILSFDEIYISQNLVYSKETGAMVGYINLNEAEKEIMELEQALSDDKKNYDWTPPVAKSMLCFMVRGIFSSVKEVVAAYGVNHLSKQFVYDRHWDVVGKLERCGLEVIGCVCDGASVNRSFIAMHPPVTESPVIFDTYNIYSWPRRPYYFFSDVPHLLKTLRNNLELRKLRLNGQEMKWQNIRAVYEATDQETFRTSYKLDTQVVYLNSYSRMRVAYAAKIFSRSLANELRRRNHKDTTELANFLEKVNDFFDMLNGCYFSEGKEKKNPNLYPYISASDKRLDMLEDFLKYLRLWKLHLQSYTKLSSKEKQMSFISHETYTGIEMTVRSFIAVIRALLPSDGTAEQSGRIRYIMARVFNQDKLEQYFMRQRARCGGSVSPNEAEFFRNMGLMDVVGDVSGSGQRGNTERHLESVRCDTTPVAKRKVARGLPFSTLLPEM